MRERAGGPLRARSIPARPGRTSAGRPRGSAAVARALRERHGLTSVVLWGPGEEPLAQEVVRERSRRRAAVAADIDRRPRRARSRRRADDVGRHRPDAHRRGASERRSSASTVRPARRATDRGRRTTSPFRATQSASAITCGAARAIGCVCSTSRSTEVLARAVERPSWRAERATGGRRELSAARPGWLAERCRVCLAEALARRRVALGFVFGALVLWLAQPTAATLAAGTAIAIAGERLRVWAAGHLNKAREVTVVRPVSLVRASALRRLVDHGRRARGRVEQSRRRRLDRAVSRRHADRGHQERGGVSAPHVRRSVRPVSPWTCWRGCRWPASLQPRAGDRPTASIARSSDSPSPCCCSC